MTIINNHIRKCGIVRVDVSGEYSRVLDSFQVIEPDTDDLGKEFYDRIYSMTFSKGYRMKYYTSPRNHPGYNYLIIVY